MAIVGGCVEQVNKLRREFGLTPAARTRIQVTQEEPKQEDGVLDGEWQPIPPKSRRTAESTADPMPDSVQ